MGGGNEYLGIRSLLAIIFIVLIIVSLNLGNKEYQSSPEEEIGNIVESSWIESAFSNLPFFKPSSPTFRDYIDIPVTRATITRNNPIHNPHDPLVYVEVWFGKHMTWISFPSYEVYKRMVIDSGGLTIDIKDSFTAVYRGDDGEIRELDRLMEDYLHMPERTICGNAEFIRMGIESEGESLAIAFLAWHDWLPYIIDSCPLILDTGGPIPNNTKKALCELVRKCKIYYYDDDWDVRRTVKGGCKYQGFEVGTTGIYLWGCDCIRTNTAEYS